MGKQFLRINAAGPDGKGLPATRHDPSDTPVHGAQHPRAYTAYTDPSGVFTAGVWAKRKADAAGSRLINSASVSLPKSAPLVLPAQGKDNKGLG